MKQKHKPFLLQSRLMPLAAVALKTLLIFEMPVLKAPDTNLSTARIIPASQDWNGNDGGRKIYFIGFSKGTSRTLPLCIYLKKIPN